MNRVDFMRQLESLLQNISPSEREEALQYYNEYFNDAGAENEQDVIEALGTPARVAENIKRDLYGSGYGESAYQKNTANNRAMVEYGQRTREEYTGNEYPAEKNKTEKKGLSTGMIVLIVVLCVLASPLILSLASGILGTLVGIICSWFAFILAFGIIAVCFVGVFVVLLVVGIMCIPADPLVGAAMIGIGMLIGGIGILFLMLTVAMAGIATPAIVRGVVALWRKLVGKKY